jgi:dienelactone hydrolase
MTRLIEIECLARSVGLCVLALAATTAGAAVVESQMRVPVTVQDMYGKTIEHTIRVTVFVDDATPSPHPILILNHGRAVTDTERAALGRARYTENSTYFARLGFVVAVPTRVGYGVTGGEDVEDTGKCSNKVFPPGYLAAAKQTQAVLAALLAQREDVKRDRTVIAGQSYGGLTAVAVASLNLPGVVAGINFAGGGGGNPKDHPGDPCAANRMERLVADYGKTARIPMLWVYTENDLYMGPKRPREWFQAFRDAGGNARMVQFPPHGEDGHSLFARFPAVWKPEVESFLREQGFKWESPP